MKKALKKIFIPALLLAFIATAVQFGSGSVFAADSSGSPAAESQTVIAARQIQAITGSVKGFVIRNGKKEEAENVGSGETVLWEMTLTNNSPRDISNINYDGLIPAGTVYVGGSASTAVQFTVDGSNYSVKPSVKGQPAPISDYKGVRFKVSLKAGETKVLTYKTTVK